MDRGSEQYMEPRFADDTSPAVQIEPVLMVELADGSGPRSVLKNLRNKTFRKWGSE